MSTTTNTLYRPIKVQDIKDCGFEIEDTCIKIHKDKIQEQIKSHNILMAIWGFKQGTDLCQDQDSNEYYYLHIFSVQPNERTGVESTWGFTRYGGNSPAADYLIESLHKLGYKMKVEGQRYCYESDMAYKQQIKNLFEKAKKHLADSK